MPPKLLKPDKNQPKLSFTSNTTSKNQPASFFQPPSVPSSRSSIPIASSTRTTLPIAPFFLPPSSLPLTPLDTLRKHFGLTNFREPQEDVITHVSLTKSDALAIMPTGGGKILCYQVPSVMMKGVGVVISPLLALISDQVSALTRRGINSCALTSSISQRDKDRCIADLDDPSGSPPKIKILNLTPEGATTTYRDLLRRIHSRGNLNLIAID